MEPLTPTAYLSFLKEQLKAEVEKVDDLKQSSMERNDYQLAGEYRDIENKLLQFICSLEQFKCGTFNQRTVPR